MVSTLQGPLTPRTGGLAPSGGPLPPSEPQAAARPSASTWDCPLDTLAGPSPSKGLPLPFSFPLCTQSQQGWGHKCQARSPTPKPGPRKTPSPPGRTICSGDPAAFSPLWSSVPLAQVRARQRAARWASSSPMVARRKAGQSAQGRGQALYAPQSRQRAGRAGGCGTGGAPPRSSGKQLWGLRGPAGEILTQVIWGLSFTAPVELAVPGMRHRLPDPRTHPGRTSVPPAAGPAWGQGSCWKLVPADSALPASPPHPSSTPGTVRSSGGLPRGPDRPVCGVGAPSHLGASQRSSGPQLPHRGPAFPEPCCPRQGRRGLLGAQGSLTSAQLLPGACELREGLAPAHSLIPSLPQPGPPLELHVIGTWGAQHPLGHRAPGPRPRVAIPQGKGPGPGKEVALSPAQAWPCRLPGQWGGPGPGEVAHRCSQTRPPTAEGPAPERSCGLRRIPDPPS